MEIPFQKLLLQILFFMFLCVESNEHARLLINYILYLIFIVMYIYLHVEKQIVTQMTSACFDLF